MKNKNLKIHYSLYNDLINFYLSDIDTDLDSGIYKDLQSVLLDLDIIVKYMLNDRYITIKKKKTSNKKSLTISSDLNEFINFDAEKSKGGMTPNVNDVLKLFKTLENFILTRNFICNNENLELGHLQSLSIKLFNSLPKLLLDIEGLEVNLRRKCLNLLFSSIIIYRHFKIKSHPKVDTITDPYKGEDIKKIINDLFSNERIDNFLERLDFNKVEKHSRLSIYSGNASSPNSGASAANMLADVGAVQKDAKLFKAIKELSSHFEGHKEFHKLVDTLAVNVALDKEFISDKIHSRLFHFTAPGGKPRMIANVDWITQSALSGIHFSLFQLLSNIPSDFTFNHPGGLGIYDKKKEVYYSIDLSAATDRMPKELQARLINRIWNKLGYKSDKISDAWLKIVDRTYSTKNSSINNGNDIRYAVGQGMGLFSSWTALAITHHYIVNELCNIPLSDYALVGDDLLIAENTSGFNNYLNIMNRIGMDVNLNKTVQSFSKDGLHNVEFARNYIISGVKIKTLPFGSLYAWHNKQCSFETSFGYMATMVKEENIPKLLFLLNPTISKINILNILYFLWRENIITDITSSELWRKLDDHQKKWVNHESFLKISTITKRPPAKITDNVKYRSNIYETLKSECVMRNLEDLSKSRLIADSIQLLSFVDDDLIEPANLIYERLINAHTLQYDVENLGNPLVTKREKNLISDLNKLNRPSNKRSKPRKKKPSLKS